MKKIIILIIIVGASYSLKPEWFLFLDGSGAFDDLGNPAVLVFTHKKCGKPCGEGIKVLKKRGVNYTEYKLDGNDDNQALWKKYGGVNSFPNIIIGKEKVYGSYKGKIVSALALNFGDSVLTPSEKLYINKHFYADGKPKLVMYGASWCPYCKKLRAALQKNNIEYTEIDVEKSPQRESMTKTLSISGYPLVYYGFKRMDGPKPAAVVALF